MKFPVSCVIEKITSPEPGRYAMAFIRVEADGGGKKTPTGQRIGRMIATDGRRLAVQPVILEDEDVVPCLMDPNAIKTARSGKTKRSGFGRVELLEKEHRAHGKTGITSFQVGEGEFPRYDAVVPPEERPPHVKPEHEAIVGLNAEYLGELQQAIGASGCRLTIRAGEMGGKMTFSINPILVQPCKNDTRFLDGDEVGHGFAVLMPISPNY